MALVGHFFIYFSMFFKMVFQWCFVGFYYWFLVVSKDIFTRFFLGGLYVV